MNRQVVLSKLDSTNLKADAKSEDIIKLCNDAIAYGFAAVCVNPCYVSLCASLLKNSEIPIAAVIGFPLGANKTIVKAFEAAQAVKEGAKELDMVINIGELKNGNIDFVEEDIHAVVIAANGAIVKVIIEACLLTDEQKVQACQSAMRAGAHFVKTSTGFSLSGATEHDVALMKATVGAKCKVKAAGGIRTLQDCEKMLEAGADRIGTGSAVAIALEKI